jgi:hypothetical protein
MFATLSSSVLALAVSGVAQMPKEPDFSGEWVLVQASGASDPAPALTVRQSITRTTARGEPMTPWFSELGVQWHFKMGVESENYKIGVIGGTVAGIPTGRSSPQGEWTTVAVTWAGTSLTIRTGKYSGPPHERGPYTEHEEVWSFDPGGRLLITITDRSSSSQPTTGRLIYRRQPTPVALPNDLKLDSRIPTADREKYRSIRDAKDWENPYLVVLRDGVDVRAKGYRSTLPVSELRQALVELPVSAWPYGAVVAVQQIHLRAVGRADDAAIKSNVDETLAVLKALNVRADLWP